MSEEKLLWKVMLAMAKAHDQIVSEREKGAHLALKCGNGTATAYWETIAKTAIKKVRRP